MAIKYLFDERVLLTAFILLGLYHLIGVFPLTPVFGDGIDIANGATHLSRTEIGPTPLGYRYSQHPGAHVILALVSGISGVDAHTSFLLICAFSAIAFVAISSLLISALTSCPIGLAGICVLLFQEASAAAYYGNSNVLAGAMGIAGLYLLHKNPESTAVSLWAGLLIGLSVFVRLDAVLLAFAAMPLLYTGSWKSMLMRTAAVASLCIVVSGGLYAASGANLTDVLEAVTFKEELFDPRGDQENTLRSHISYFSALTVILIIAGAFLLMREKKWNILAICAAGIVPFYILFPDGVDTPRYLYYAIPFWALLVSWSIWCIRSIDNRSLQCAILFLLSVLFAGQYLLGVRVIPITDQQDLASKRGVRITDDSFLVLKLGPGDHAVGPSVNGGRLASGLLFAPQWHRIQKEMKRQRTNQLHDLLSSKQGETYLISVMGWTEATLVRWSLLKQGYEFRGVNHDPSAGTSEYEFALDGHSVRETHYRLSAVQRVTSDISQSPIHQKSVPGDIFVVRNQRLAESVLSGVEAEWEQKTWLAHEKVKQ